MNELNNNNNNNLKKFTDVTRSTNLNEMLYFSGLPSFLVILPE